MLEDKFEIFANKKNWRFVNARREYQNLIDATNFISDEINCLELEETILFLDPLIRTKTTVSGNFMILTRSDLDDSYKKRKEKYINPLIEIVMNELHNFLRCDFDVNNWQLIEVINVFDFNADGVSVSFNLNSY